MVFVTIVVFLGVFGHITNGGPIEKQDTSRFYTSRIFGGVDTPEGFAPYMVALIVGETNPGLLCGGSLISNRHVLTAAHCIDAVTLWEQQLYELFLGVVGSNRWTSTENRIRFSHFKNHPKWDNSVIKNDIGVLFTTKIVELSDSVAVISLNFEWVGGGEQSYVTGYGLVGFTYDDEVVNLMSIPEKLQLLYVETISGERCVEEVEQASLLWGPAPPVDPRIEVCTFHSPDHGMCNGDSGSALVSVEDGRQFGVVSWGFPCARGVPDVYVRLSSYKDFLLPVLSEYGQQV